MKEIFALPAIKIIVLPSRVFPLITETRQVWGSTLIEENGNIVSSGKTLINFNFLLKRSVDQ